MYHFCALMKLKNPKLAVASQGLSVVYWAFSTWLQTEKELFEWVSRFSLLTKCYQPAWCTWNLLIVNSTTAPCRSHVPFCWWVKSMMSPFISVYCIPQCLLPSTQMCENFTFILIYWDPDLEINLGLKDEDFDTCKWQKKESSLYSS